MPQCDGCGTTTAPSYYIPHGYDGLCMCPNCVRLVIDFEFVLDNRKEMCKELKRIMEKVAEEDVRREARFQRMMEETSNNRERSKSYQKTKYPYIG